MNKRRLLTRAVMVQIQILADSTAAAAISRGLTEVVATAEALPNSPAPACNYHNTLMVWQPPWSCNLLLMHLVLSRCTQCLAHALNAELWTAKKKAGDESSIDVASVTTRCWMLM